MKQLIIILFFFSSNFIFGQSAVNNCCNKPLDCEDVFPCLPDPCIDWETQVANESGEGFSNTTYTSMDDCGNNITVVDTDTFFPDTNTTYSFNAECEDGGIHFEYEGTDGASYDQIVDISCHIELVMEDEIEDLQDQIDDIGTNDPVSSCTDVVACLPADLQDGDDDTTYSFANETIRATCYEARGYNNTVEYSYNSTITNVGTGQYIVIFNPPHPQGTNYAVTFGAEEDNNRDVPKISVIRNTIQTTGFQFIVTVDDNGAGADVFDSAGWHFRVSCEKTIITNATEN